MSTVLENALENAFKANGETLNEKLKVKDYSNFVWKGEKKKDGDNCVQEQKKLIDMTSEELNKCYSHCNKMLYNTNPKNLGRYNVLEEVNSQINKCNIELLLRYFENSYQRDNRGPIKRFSLMISLRELMKNNPEISDWSLVPITQISNELPSEFNNINIADVLEGCVDALGALDKQHLTMTFITSMGIWLTKAEENEFKEPISNVEKLKIIREKLHLSTKLPLKFDVTGLSYHEMRAMLTLPRRQKYSDMTTEQLITLRNKVLLRFQRVVDGHIFNWNRLKKQIELVAKEKGIQLEG